MSNIVGNPKCTAKKFLKSAYQKIKKVGSSIKNKILKKTEDCVCDKHKDGYVRLKQSPSSADIFSLANQKGKLF